MVVPVAVIPADVFVGGGEVAESRSELARAYGSLVSLLDATAAESDFVVYGAVAGLVSENVDGLGAGCGTNGSVSDLCAAAHKDRGRLVFAGFTSFDFFDWQLYFFQFAGGRDVRVFVG